MLLTGVPKLNYTGPKLADVLRLNLSIPVTQSPNRLGVLGGDTQGWPNGRRLGDDVIDIAEQAVGGFLKGRKLPLGRRRQRRRRRAARRRSRTSRIRRAGFDNTKGVQKP